MPSPTSSADHSSPDRSEPPRPRSPEPVRAAQVAERVNASWSGDDAITLTGITLDSRSVQPGDLWAALPGARTHGARFATQAAQRGAQAALTDAAGAHLCSEAGLAVIEVEDPRAATALAAAEIYAHPAAQLSMLAVTGTNGKTSVTSMVRQALMELEVPVGMIGTSGTFYRDRDGVDHSVGTERTTPESPDIQGILARMREDGVQVCAMEVSSHALVLRRADQVPFAAACFMNLTQDHLDFHGSMQEYFDAKALLFTPEHSACGFVCVDDQWGRELARTATVPVTTFTTRDDVDADITARDLTAQGFGTAFTVTGDHPSAHPGTWQLQAPLPGRHYVANTVAAWLLLRSAGISADRAAAALAHAGTIPGRLEQVRTHPVRGVVDYSHTPDAITQTLRTLREVPGTARIITVMGAGGDRDRSKRPLMGQAAAEASNIVVITEDNPRSEDPAQIRADVAAGTEKHPDCEVHLVAGRERAIDLAASLSRPGDTILLAGKGDETGQDIGGVVHPFDDRVHLRAALDRYYPRADGLKKEDSEC